MENKTLYEEPFEGKDIQMEAFTEADMPDCANCKFSNGHSGSCQIYSKKPNGVILGTTKCSRYDN